MKKKSVIAVLLLCSILIGCGVQESEEENKEVTSNVDQRVEESTVKVPEELPEKKKLTEIEDFEKDYERPFLGTDCIMLDTNAFYYYEMDSDKTSEYKRRLVQAGYELLLKETVEGITYENYTNGERRIQTVDLGQTTILSIVNNYATMKSEENVYATKDVLMRIQELEELKWENEKSEVTGSASMKPAIVIKYWIPELYEKMNMQAYVSYTKEGKRGGPYLLYCDQIYDFSGTFDTLENTCIADIDGNGTYELLSLCGWGSGIYRLQLNIYQYGNPYYFNSLNEVIHLCYSNVFVPKRGYGELAFLKVSDQEVHLMEKYPDDKDYGKLMILDETKEVVPERIEEFPYYQWNHQFKTSNTDEKEENPPKMDEVPELCVTISGKKIFNQSSKLDWNGISNEPIAFQDVMAGDILRFDYPHGYEYIDEICFSFTDAVPSAIRVEDVLIDYKAGTQLFSKAGLIEREVRIDEDGNYYLGLMEHYALLLSSASSTYTEPSYRGFRVICQFGSEQKCEYVFVVSIEPAWDTPVPD